MIKSEHDSNDGGVLISNGRSSVRLTRVGEPIDSGYELGYPLLYDVKAGPFSGSVRSETVRLENFRAQLGQLYATLVGSAILESYNGSGLDLIGDGRGGIAVRVKIVADHLQLIQLTFSISIDQSFLPAIIRQLDIEFPPPYRAAV